MQFVYFILSVNMILMFFQCGESVTEYETVDEQETTGTTVIRFIHSAATTGGIDIYYLDVGTDQLEGIISNAEYGKQYGYYEFDSGSLGFEAYISGTDLLAASVIDDFQDGWKYSVVATDFGATLNPTLLVVADTTGTPGTGNAFLRFLHASADAPDIDIREADGTTIFEDLSRYQPTTYIEMEADTYFFRVVSSETGDDLPEISAITLLPGVHYMAILSGTVNGLPGPGFNVKMYPETGISRAMG